MRVSPPSQPSPEKGEGTLLKLVDFYKVAHFEQHSSNGRSVIVHYRLVELTQTKSLDRAALVPLVAYPADFPCY